MAEDTSSNVSIESETTVSKQRKRRKWDQPAESLVSCSVPVSTSGIIGISHPLSGQITNALAMNPVPPIQPLPQNAKEIIQKLNQEELIAREIVINDAEPNTRQKLTKRQTQDEIQKNTGAIVITRGKYMPRGSSPNGEKPLYLHIGAGSHLKDTSERIRAVDKAASMIEDILKQDQTLLTHVVQPLSLCIYLGFDPDPSLNIANRIRGPNDQYINHIMNETGATVMLKGRNSGSTDTCHSQESLQPLHLYLSSSNPKNLEAARILAENLLDTIALECRASRNQSLKTYSTIPPVVTSYPPPPVLTSGTRYSGYYEGIYPQATPLQQVALALKQASPAGVTAMNSSSSMSLNLSVEGKNGNVSNKPTMQKRKFQELPVSSIMDHQGSEFYKLDSEETSDMMPPPHPKNLDELGANGNATPVSNQIMPPPPTKFAYSQPSLKFEKMNSDTLLKLVEYGEEDDDDEDESDEAQNVYASNSTRSSGPKPFWAV